MLLSIIIKSTIIYFFVMIVIKFMGKREIGQLSYFNYSKAFSIFNVEIC